ncbi:MAG: pantetheine-phosphate adenylyltransferase [Nitrospiraceae bacterium]|nr:pantetheine-phosphate adenylyltransferase [Nitrospiraceae bacterium]MDA8090827.1 pantetheine-phosphate adenylyltransferase [Nitrospiraceae bacterium]
MKPGPVIADACVKDREIKRAVLPGTFDPLTNGHLDLLLRGLGIFDEVIIAVAPSHKKKPAFTIEERLRLINEAVKGIKRTKVEAFEGLLVDYVHRAGAGAIIRGLRAVSDFEYEFQMALMNRSLDACVETVFLMPSAEYTFLTSSMIKEVALFGGCVKGLVPENVEAALKKKYKAIKSCK